MDKEEDIKTIVEEAFSEDDSAPAQPAGPVFRLKGRRYRTTSLFKETIPDSTYDLGVRPIFTLRDEDIPEEGLLSLRKKYLEVGDPTEYRFARSCLGGWEHWKLLCSSPVLYPFIEKWRSELQVKLMSDAFDTIKQAMDGLDRSKAEIEASRWVHSDLLLGRSMALVPKGPTASENTTAPSSYSVPKRGRPPKAAVRPPTPHLKELQEEYDRMVAK